MNHKLLLRIGRVQTHQSDHLDTPLVELILQLGERTQFRGTNGSEVGRVREQDGPVVADELVEVNLALGGQSLEVGSCTKNLSNDNSQLRQQ